LLQCCFAVKVLAYFKNFFQYKKFCKYFKLFKASYQCYIMSPIVSNLTLKPDFSSLTVDKTYLCSCDSYDKRHKGISIFLTKPFSARGFFADVCNCTASSSKCKHKPFYFVQKYIVLLLLSLLTLNSLYLSKLEAANTDSSTQTGSRVCF